MDYLARLMPKRGVLYLPGVNLQVVWAEFSPLSWAVLFQNNLTQWHVYSLF
jgi:hypothetical protein